MRILPVSNYNKTFFTKADKESVENKDTKNPIPAKYMQVLTGASILGMGALALYSVYQGKRIKKMEVVCKNSQEQLKSLSGGINPLKETLHSYNIVPFEFCGLYQEFKKSAKGFVEFLKNTEAEPAKVKEFLFAATSDEKVSHNIVKEFTANPRESLKIVKVLNEKLGGIKNLTEWLQKDEGYYGAYGKYVNGLYEKAKSVDELVKISPNWHLFALLKKTNDFNVRFGELPKDFAFIKDYNNFCNWLAHMNPQRGVSFQKEYDNHYMMIELLGGGSSSKFPFKVQFVDSEGANISKPYVIKLQKPGFRHIVGAEKEAEAYRSDSVFIDAQIDRYLNLNDCKNANRLHFYDYLTDSAIYSFEEGENPEKLAGDIRKVNEKLQDLNELGIYFNDVGNGNFINQNGVLKIIDIGESTFIDPLRPGVPYLHFELPNWSGRSLPDLRRLQL